MSASIHRNAFYERNHMFAPGNHVVLNFEVKGKITKEQLQKALEKARIKHPLIGVHVEFDKEGEAWFVSENTPPIQIIEQNRENDHTWLEAVFSAYWDRFEITKGPLIKFLLIQSSEKTDLVTIAQHTICDGLSLVYLLRDILQFIANPSTPVQPIDIIPTLKDAYDLESIKLNPLIRKLVAKMKTLWEEKKIRLEEQDFIPIHDAFQAKRFNAELWSLDNAATGKLISKCHSEGVSVNSALYCAIMMVQKELQDDGQKFRRKIMMPINIRKFLIPPVGEEVGLFAGGDYYKMKVNPKSDFWRQAQKFQSKLEKGFNPDSMFMQAKKIALFPPGMMDVRSLVFYGPMMETPTEKYNEVVKILESDAFLKKMNKQNASGKLQLGCILTNIGALHIPNTYGDYDLSAVHLLPPSSILAEKIIGVVSYEGVLRGTIAFLESIIDVKTISKFARSLEAYLKKISA